MSESVKEESVTEERPPTPAYVQEAFDNATRMKFDLKDGNGMSEVPLDNVRKIKQGRSTRYMVTEPGKGFSVFKTQKALRRWWNSKNGKWGIGHEHLRRSGAYSGRSRRASVSVKQEVPIVNSRMQPGPEPDFENPDQVRDKASKARNKRRSKPLPKKAREFPPAIQKELLHFYHNDYGAYRLAYAKYAKLASRHHGGDFSKVVRKVKRLEGFTQDILDQLREAKGSDKKKYDRLRKNYLHRLEAYGGDYSRVKLRDPTAIVGRGKAYGIGVPRRRKAPPGRKKKVNEDFAIKEEDSDGEDSSSRVKPEPQPYRTPVVPHGSLGSKELPHAVGDVIQPEPDISELSPLQYEAEEPLPGLDAIEFQAEYNAESHLPPRARPKAGHYKEVGSHITGLSDSQGTRTQYDPAPKSVQTAASYVPSENLSWLQESLAGDVQQQPAVLSYPEVHPDEEEKAQHPPPTPGARFDQKPRLLAPRKGASSRHSATPSWLGQSAAGDVNSDAMGGLDDDSSFALDSEEEREIEAQQKRMLDYPQDRVGTMPTRWTGASNVGAGQELVRNPPALSGLSLGIRNVRGRPRRIPSGLPAPVSIQPAISDGVSYVPGGYVNPGVKNWYYQKSFEPKYKKNVISSAYPWLFGPQGLYPSIYDMCPEDCMVDGVCICSP